MKLGTSAGAIVFAHPVGVYSRAKFVVAMVLTMVLGLPLTPAVAASGTPGSAVIGVYEPGGLSTEAELAVVGVAAEHGARSVALHRGTIQLTGVYRSGFVVQEPEPGYFIPMSSLAIDPGRSAPLIGGDVAAALRAGTVVFGETSANLRGAQVGDDVEFVGWDGSRQRLVVGAIAPDESIWWSELVFSEAIAASFGFERKSSMAVWGFRAQDEIVIDLWTRLPDIRLRISSGDDPADPDGVMPTVLVKEKFGEFSYRPTGDGDRVVIEQAWKDANIVNVTLPLLGPFRCHRVVVPYLRSAIDELINEGLWAHIDRQDFQIAGGCYNPRLIRGGDKGGAVSRHTWGIAIDINPNDNPYGGRIGMDPDIAAIFQKWGFAWGGGWTYTDGGHFEWNHVPDHLLED
ncbi:MAG: M15 family metallopeptidase [Acidimicrobiia bacterium]|nr:M15 family metallopeptidase [Acidimicrobiia bacterium]